MTAAENIQPESKSGYRRSAELSILISSVFLGLGLLVAKGKIDQAQVHANNVSQSPSAPATFVPDQSSRTPENVQMESQRSLHQVGDSITFVLAGSQNDHNAQRWGGIVKSWRVDQNGKVIGYVVIAQNGEDNVDLDCVDPLEE